MAIHLSLHPPVKGHDVSHPHMQPNIHAPPLGKPQKAKSTDWDLRVSSLARSHFLPQLPLLALAKSKQYTPHPVPYSPPPPPPIEGTTLNYSLFRNLPTHQPESPEGDSETHHCNSTDLHTHLKSRSFSEVVREYTSER